MQANITIQTEDLVTGAASTPVTAIIGFDIIYLKGDKGNSAYEDAVEQGYVGTLEQWLESLHGDDGFSPSVNATKEGDTATITITDKNGTTSTTIKDGKDGDDGISPQVSVTKVNGVVTVTITDKNGTTSQQINDGTDGDDGVSPTVSISKSGSVTTITITDKNGEHTATINDGENPQELIWATYGTTTYTEIATANSAGKAVLCWYQDRVYMLSSISATSCTLATNTTTYVYSIAVSSGNVWSSSNRPIPNSIGNSDSSYSISSPNYSAYVPTMERMHTIINTTLSREELTGWQDGYIDVTTTPISDTVNPSTAGTKYLMVEVNEGEVYCLNVKGGTAPRAYAIADANKAPIKSAAVSATLCFYYIKIPTGGKYLYLHSSLDLSTYKCYRIKTAKDVENRVNSLAQLFTIEYEDGTTENINIYSETVV